MSHSGIRLYVKSVKVVTGTMQVQHVRLRESYPVETEPKHEFVLDEDQQKIVELVREIAVKHRLEVEVVDVTRENVLRRTIQEELERIKTFPTLVVDSGKKFEGEMTKEQVESVFSRIADPRRKKYL